MRFEKNGRGGWNSNVYRGNQEKGNRSPGYPPPTGKHEPVVLRPQPPLTPPHDDRGGQEVLRRLGLAGWSAILLVPFLVLLGIFLALIFIGRPYVVHGSSMFPTLSDGNRVFVVPYRGNTTPDRGDIVVLRDMAGTSEMLIKRVVAIAGDKLYIGNGEVIVNDQISYRNSGKSPAEPTTELVPDNNLFVMGDNESHSYDSRTFGPVPMNKVVGKALFIFWPPGDLRKL